MDVLNAKLLQRSIGRKRTHLSIKPLYSDRSWVEDLDIINELGAHTGCVNALSWSTTGALLASGSDDKYLNIWDYNPANLAKPFSLNTSVSTGHSANIFSVKFMPHSNDRTVVTCAGDSEVRVFDLEYAGGQGSGDTTSASTRSRRFNEFFSSARWLNEGNTNTRVYRSHADRAKRIVTESSPHLFLTCSEDGEVRQWDLRQPSSAYPPPHGLRRMGRLRPSSDEDVSENVPPPLISYKAFQLDLNSISCSGSQPHYIALGGAHLHCFLHDRRMLGRDISREQGRPGGPKPSAGSAADEGMREATKCVRRFAPHNKRKMGIHDSGHITACKISDARPNELISSWSGDHIYSFDIIKSPDAREREEREQRNAENVKLRNLSDRKRKRAKASGSSPSVTGASRRRVEKVGSEGDEEGQTAVRVRYNNGETEDISMDQTRHDPEDALAHMRNSLLSEAQRQSERVARSLVQLRKTLFDFSARIEEEQAQALEHSSELTPFTSTFTKSLGQAASLLPDMDEIMRSWTYPVNPDEEQVEFQNTLRRNRQAGWRFVQAAGALSATLGGRLQTLGATDDPRLIQFAMIKPAPREDRHMIPQSIFCYDFLKAILLWLNGGISAVLEGFQKPPDHRGEGSRFPMARDDTIAMVPGKIREYLLSMAAGKPIIDLGTNRFERSELRCVFESQEAAVQSFIRALSGIELRENQGLSGIKSDSSRTTTMRIMDKGAAARFWGLKVGRSLLIEAAPDVTFSFVQHAFGGPRVRIMSDEENLGHLPHVISSDEEDERVITAVDLIGDDNGESGPRAVVVGPDAILQSLNSAETELRHANDDELTQSPGDDEDPMLENDDEEEDDNDQDAATEHEEDDDESSSDDEDPRPLYHSRRIFGRAQDRADVNIDVPYSSHSKVFKGHCNTRTVKDVNYYGLDDEYVVSGSDDGHLFIWDRKTCQVVNILEGDGEVVNVVQGHPYEPMIACSGIDSTVKIFGPGGRSRDRCRASRGLDVANPGGGVHSSLRFGRMRRSNLSDDDDDEVTDNLGTNTTSNHDDSDDDRVPSVARNGLQSRKAMSRYYQITSQNDVMRRQGVGDALVTEGMLARFATLLQRGELQGITGQGFGAAGGTVVLDDNCTIM